MRLIRKDVSSIWTWSGVPPSAALAASAAASAAALASSALSPALLDAFASSSARATYRSKIASVIHPRLAQLSMREAQFSDIL